MAERPTPHSIALGTLIALNSDPSFDLYDETNVSERNGSERLWDVLQGIVLGDENESGGNQSLDRLLHQVEHYAGPRPCKLLLEYVEMSASSVDALLDLMESLRASVEEGIVDSSSSHGIFLRRLCLGFDQLSFEAVTRLWDALRKTVVRIKKTKRDTSTTTRGDSSQSSAEDTFSPGLLDMLSWPPSPEQTELFLRSQCIHMDTGVQKSYEEIEMQIQAVLERDPELPTAHFLRFLNFLNNGERVGAIDSLHQYFDYAMIKERKDSQTTTKHDVLQYAAILLAAVHSSFGVTDLSFNATEEAVRVAQASGDKACVAYALGWLYLNAKQGLGDDELLRRCSSRAVDSKLRCLAGGANLALARHYLTTPSVDGRRSHNALPSHAWESLMASSTDHPASSTSLVMDKPTHVMEFPSSNDALRIMALQCLVGAGVWDSFGFANLSGLSSFVAFHSYIDSLSSHDVAAAMQDIARVALYGQGSQTIPVNCKPGALLSHLEKLGRMNPRDTSCIYAESLRKLIDLRKILPNPGNTSWTNSVLLVLHEWAVRRGELEDANALTCMLHSYLHPRIPNYRDVMVETYGQHGLLLCRQGQWEKAKSLTNRLCSLCKDWGLRTQHAKLLIQLAVIQFEASPRNFIGALAPLLECLSMCEEFAMDSLHATALSLLAKVHLELRNARRATALLKAALPTILRDAHVWFQGELFLTLANCNLFQANLCHAKRKERQVSRLLRCASGNLERSCELFEKCQDVVRLKEVSYLQARVYHALPGHKEKRNEASKRFRRAGVHLAKSRSPSCPDVLKLFTSISAMERLASRPVPTVL